MKKWRAYPEYKDSGMEWLVEIPEHWDIHKLKHVASVNFSNVDKHTVDGEEPVRLCNYVDVYYNDLIIADLNLMEATATPTEITKFALKAGDVIITKDSEAWDDIAIPAYVSSDIPGVLCGYHLAQIRPNPKRVDGKYLFRSFCSRGINDQFRVEATGITRYGLGKYWLDNGLFPIPPIDEQRAIAAFLDRETSRIDALIAKKQRHLQLLLEKRAALISHAVTKGLDPNVKMKDCGIEWLGVIPEHWGICLLKRVMNIAYGVGGELDRTLSEGIPILSLPNVTIDGNLELEEVPFTELSVSQRSEFLLRKGDLLFNWRNGSSNHLGKTAYFDLGGEYTHVSFLLRLRCDHEKNNSRYFHHLLNGLRITGFFSSSKAGVNNTFNLSELSNLWVILPPVAEQRSIAAFLDRETMRIEGLITRVNRSISLLREYRTALISAAVTGKIDVRDNCQ